MVVSEMRIESSSAVNEQALTNRAKSNALPEMVKPALMPVANFVPEHTEEVEKSQQPNIAEESLSKLLKEAEYELNFQLSFSIHKETNRVVVKVIDPESNKVLRQIPPEELLDLAVKLQEMLGILIDKRV